MKFIRLICLSLVIPACLCAVTPAQSAMKKPDPAAGAPAMNTSATAKEAGRADALLLTDAEKQELGRASQFLDQARREFDQALADALEAPMDRLAALEALGRLQRSKAVERAAEQHFNDLREKHKAARADCAKCDYAPDGSRLVRPAEK
jgi:hypothetical protein